MLSPAPIGESCLRRKEPRPYTRGIQKTALFFEDVGDWKRPLCFLREDEDVQAAVSRECKVARNAAAMMDATTLGKIDIQGPDAPEFMDILYTNQMSTLKPGRCRYGMMLREDGMVYDDGVAICLAPNHYHITTSTGHAAGVMTWLEEWLTNGMAALSGVLHQCYRAVGGYCLGRA